MFLNQPFQRTRSSMQQLHRFLGMTSGRTAQCARSLVEALDLAADPPPLAAVLEVAAHAA